MSLILPALTEAKSPFFRPVKYALFPPLGLATLAGYLAADDEVTLQDEHVETLDTDDDPELVVLQCYVTSARRTYELADRYRRRGAHVAIGGLHPTSLPDEAARHADTVFVGPGEDTWPEFLADLRAGRPRPLYRSRSRTLDGLPLLRRDLIKRQLYLVPNSLVVSRGCPHSCGFCYKEGFFAGGRGYYHQRVDQALAEIERLPGRHLYFLDDHLFGDPRFAEALFDGMRGMGRLWQAAATVASVLRPGLLEKARQSGLRSLFVGFETLREESLRAQRKHSNLGRDYDAAVRRLHELGVMVNGSFVFGMDGDSPDVFDRTVEWAVSAGIETATFHVLTPYPGSALFRELEAQDRLLHRDWDCYDTRHAVFEPRGMTAAQLESGYWRAYGAFYGWRAIARAAATKPTFAGRLRHLAYGAGWKKLEPVWDLLIRSGLVGRARPVLERVLDAAQPQSGARSPSCTPRAPRVDCRGPPARGRMPRPLLIALAPSLLLGPACAGASAAAAPATTGVVLYSDPAWRRLYVHDGSAVRSVPVDALSTLPPARHRIELASPAPVDLGPALPPEPTAVGVRPAETLAWVTLAATVRSAATASDGRALLHVATAAGPLDVYVLPGPAPPGVAVGARLRLRGVLEPSSNPWSRRRLWVAAWTDVVVVAVARPWDEIAPLTAAAVRVRAQSAFDDEIRLRGRAIARRSVRSFRIEDATGALTVDLERPDLVREGTTYEVRGFAARRRGEPVLVDARWRTIGTPPSRASRHESGLPLLTRVAAVRALPRAEAERGYPVRLEGVATYVSPARWQLFLQDATGGIYVHVGPGDTGIAPGDGVRIEGFTAPGGLAPIVVDPVIHRLGTAELPQAPPVSAARLAGGSDDCRRVEVTGTVRRVQPVPDEVELTLGVEGLRVLVHLPAASPGETPPPVDARVRVRAVCGTAFNWRSLFDHVELFVAAPGDLLVEEAPADPSSLPLLPIRDLLRSQANGRWERLVRTRGVVLHQREGGTLYVRGAAGTVIVETSGLEPFAPGDEVEVVGFPAAGGAAPRLEDAGVRLVGRGRPALPIVVDALDAFGYTLDAELARFDAVLLESVAHETGTGLVLQVADRVIEARGDGDLPGLPEGAVLGVTGVLLADEHDDGAGPQLRVVLRRPDDVRVVARPPWLTPRRAGWFVGGLAIAALVALTWVETLRRRVRARTAELRSTEERYRLLAENASDVILTTDTSLRLTYVSPSVTRDSGYTIEEALAMPLERVIAPESWARLRAALARTDESRAPAGLELEIRRKDGSSRWMHVRTSPLRAADGSVTGFLAAARDITARRKAQQELARLAAAIEQSVDAIVLTDPSGAILYVNPAFERVTGYASQEVLGRNAGLLKSGVHDQAFYEGLWATLRAGNTWEGRFTNKRKDGRVFLEDATIAPVREADGRLVGYVAVKRDVTRQVQLEDRLAQAEKLEAVGRLAAGIAHDFNNTLAIILNLADLALKGRAVDERTRTCIEGMREAALRAGGLTRQILTFSRQSPAGAVAVFPREVVAEAVRMLRLLVPQGVEIRERLESNAAVATDATQLQQVVLNLGTNAGLALPVRGGLIEIELEDVAIDEEFAAAHPPLPAGRAVRLTVRDDGYGMRPETVARIFEPFFTTRAATGGTGMGLAMVHGIVHNHGGTITVESGLGRGSTFRVYLPALRGADAAGLASTPVGTS